MVIRALIVSLLYMGSISAPITAFAGDEPIKPIVAVKPKNPDMVELGKMLFFDPRLSKSGFISCNSCQKKIAGSDLASYHVAIRLHP